MDRAGKALLAALLAPARLPTSTTLSAFRFGEERCLMRESDGLEELLVDTNF